MNTDFIYLPETDKVLFLNKIQKIDIYREKGKVTNLKFFLESADLVVRKQRDIQVICDYFMIPSIVKSEKNNV